MTLIHKGWLRYVLSDNVISIIESFINYKLIQVNVIYIILWVHFYLILTWMTSSRSSILMFFPSSWLFSYTWMLKQIIFLKVLSLLIHFQFSMRSMRMKLTTLCSRSLVKYKITIESLMPVCSAKSPKEISKEKNMSRLTLM